MLISEIIDEQTVVYPFKEFNSGQKKKERERENKLLMHTATWMNLKTITWNEGKLATTEYKLWFHSYEVQEQTKRIRSDGSLINSCLQGLGGKVDCKRAGGVFLR